MKVLGNKIVRIGLESELNLTREYITEKVSEIAWDDIVRKLRDNVWARVDHVNAVAKTRRMIYFKS